MRDTDPVSEIVLAVGEERTLPLRSLAMSGYRWSGSVGGPDPGAVTVEVRRGDLEGPASPGTSTPEEAVLCGIRPGSAVVRLEQRRPWEGDAPAAQVVELQVEVDS